MRKLGFEVTEKVGKTGIVAVLRNGAGPTVLVRTELDGLPMEEKTGLPYASRGAATHSCGHDVHMASWLGAARTLHELKAQWKGTLVFIGQPAEETVSGAKAMLDDGLFTRFPKPDVPSPCTPGRWPTGRSASMTVRCPRTRTPSRSSSRAAAAMARRRTRRSIRSRSRRAS
jgi:metal-dependent amidase/aminoacylase/carboxypeptidase family protein